jgi:hypothetical protein
MKYEVILNIKVDPTSNFLEVDDVESSKVILQLIQDMLYDVEDVTIEMCEVIRHD